MKLGIDKTEEVKLAEIYMQDGEIGIRLSRDGTKRLDIYYFLESICRVHRRDYDNSIRDVGGRFLGE